MPSLRWSRPTIVLAILAALALISIVCFMTLGARGSWSFIIPFRGRKLIGLLLVAYSVAVSTVLFQTVTNNRILTPSIMGFDALYILLQTSIVFFLGPQMLALMNPYMQFSVELVLMIGFSWLLFQWLFLNEGRSLHLLVLVGIVFGIFFRSLSSFMQRMLDPNAFQVLQDSFFASFSTIDTTLLGVSMGIISVVTLVLWRMGHTFDVLSLGRDTAINLGVEYKRSVVIILVMVSVLVSVSTALGVIALVGGQTLFERVFEFDTALSIIVEFLGGLVFIILILRGAAR